MPANLEVLEALAVTSEVCGHRLSEGAARVIAEDLVKFEPPHVLAALERCRAELQGPLTLAAVIQRIPDGRPDPEEAWALCLRSFDEDASLCLTDEILACREIARVTFAEGDRIASRMAFREAYSARISEGRRKGIAPKWSLSLGYAVAQRQEAVAEAFRRGILSERQAQALIGPPKDGEVPGSKQVSVRAASPEQERRLRELTGAVARHLTRQ